MSKVMAAVDKQTYWDLAKAGKLCDLTLVEKTADGQSKEHHVHKLVMYAESPYFRTFFDQDMRDKNTDRVTIETESTELGLLKIVIEAMYAKSGRAEQLYYTYTGEHDICETMYLYMLCSYLGLEEHISYLQTAIKEFVSIGDLTMWWRERQEVQLVVPPGVETMVQRHLQASLKYIGAINEAYISVQALLNLWPNIDDPVSKSVREFLSNLGEVAEEISKDNDNPNQWIEDDDEMEVLPESIDHPELHPYDLENNRWIDPESNFIFTQGTEKKWYVTSKLDEQTQFAADLTVEDRTFARRLGWRTIEVGHDTSIGYILFSRAKRASIKEDNPVFRFTDVRKRIREMWDVLSDHEKMRWNAKAARQNDDVQELEEVD